MNPLLAREWLGMSWAGHVVLLGFFALLLAVFSALSPWFWSFDNMVSMGANMAFIGIMAAAGTPLIVAGGLDLSVAAVAGLAGVIVAQLHEGGIGAWPAALVALVFGAAAGVVNGLLATGLRLNPLIVTLGTMSIITGVSLVMTGGLTRPLSAENFNWIGNGRPLGIPFPLILMLVLFFLLWLAEAFTPFGRQTYAAGGNPEAARLLGVRVERVQIILYTLSGLSGALAGVVLAAMLGAAAPDAAGRHVLTIITAIILGGTSLFGGRGGVWGTLLAVLILGALNNGLTLLNVSSFWQDVTRGIVLLCAVALDQARARAAEA